MCKGVALVAEGLSLFEYFKLNKDLGVFGPFGVTGISMGGHMAALAGLFDNSVLRESVSFIWYCYNRL